MARVLAALVEGPVGVEIADGAQGTQAEDRLGAVEAPARPVMSMWSSTW
jgi:hypothetical protein